VQASCQGTLVEATPLAPSPPTHHRNLTARRDQLNTLLRDCTRSGRAGPAPWVAFPTARPMLSGASSNLTTVDVKTSEISILLNVKPRAVRIELSTQGARYAEASAAVEELKARLSEAERALDEMVDFIERVSTLD